MGADFFEAEVEGIEDAYTAFRQAVEKAQYDHGHAGYTGTIAEKDDFTILYDVPAIAASDPYRYLVDDARIQDKWGPAGAVKTDTGWLFVGFASS